MPTLPRLTLASIQQLTPRRIDAGHYLADATAKAAGTFKLDGKSVKLVLDSSVPQSAVVREYPLRPALARKLNRSTDVVEAVSSAVLDAASVAELDAYMAKVKAAMAGEPGQYYFVTLRRRKPKPSLTAVEMLSLAKKTEVERTVSVVLRIMLNKKFSSLRRIGIVLPGGMIVLPVPDDGDEEDSGETATSHPDSSASQTDYGTCVMNCLDEVPAWLWGLIGTACAPCIGAAAAASGAVVVTGGAAAPLSAGAFALACTPCAAVLGATFAPCIMGCFD